MLRALDVRVAAIAKEDRLVILPGAEQFVYEFQSAEVCICGGDKLVLLFICRFEAILALCICGGLSGIGGVVTGARR